MGRNVMSAPAGRIGIDTGGTFTDLVSVDPAGQAAITKLPSDATAAQIADSCATLAFDRASEVVHGTTRITNAILEGRFARTALVTTRGFRDVLAIGRQARESLYALDQPARVAPVVPDDLAFEVDERISADGTVLRSLTDDAITRIRGELADAGADAVAVCLLHAYAHPEHELALGSALATHHAVSLSHRVSAERREYERASTTVLNAAVTRFAADYLGDLEVAVAEALPDARLFVMHSAGGMMRAADARALPLATVMSGPAGGVAACAQLARREQITHALAFDMGGTSTDVALIEDGIVPSARDRRLAGHAVRLPAVAVESIATGGGSIAYVDDVGALRVGPRSAGALPGPACFGRGGCDPTLTDADLVLGLLDPAVTLGGITLDADAAWASIEPLAGSLGLGVIDAARAIVGVATAQVVRALRLVTINRGHDLRLTTLVAYGGGGPVHAAPVAAAAGIRRVIVPPLASGFSALGCCLAELAVERAHTHLVALDAPALPRITQRLDDLSRAAVATLGHAEDDPDVSIQRLVEARYRGQNDELAIACPPASSLATLRQAFSAEHRRRYGYTTDEPLEVTTLRCRVSVHHHVRWPTPQPVSSASAGETRMLLGRGPAVLAPVIASESIGEHTSIPGPALITTPGTSITVCAGQSARATGGGAIIVEAS
jgi:N-methylhydantoinase A